MGKIISLNSVQNGPGIERGTTTIEDEGYQDKVISLCACRWPVNHDVELVHPILKVNLRDTDQLTEVKRAMDAIESCKFRMPERRREDVVFKCAHKSFQPRSSCPNPRICGATHGILK